MKVLQSPDRSKDLPPPQDKNATHPCKCGSRMVGRLDKTNAHQGEMRWYWWCGCGAVEHGGYWHPMTEDEAVYRRWRQANA